MDEPELVTGRALSLAYIAAGEGEPPLCLLHGWGASKSIWRPSLEHFARRHRVIAFDLPGHGESGRATGGYHPPAMAHRLIEALAELEVGRVVFVGHSLGAVVAIAAALERPELSAGLVLVGPPDPAYLRRTVRLLADDDLALAAMRALRRGYGVVGHLAPARGGSRLGAFLRRAQATGMADEVALVEAARAVAATELDRRLGSLTVPTLVIAGRLDFTASPEGARRIAQALPAARLVELPLTGHHPMDERPERFRAIVDAWLAAAGQAPGADGIRAEGSMP